MTAYFFTVMRAILRRTFFGLLILAAAAAAWLLFYGGRYLQHEDPLQKADVIFVLGGARGERWLEAYDLYRAGYAPRIMLSPERPEAAETLLRAQGIHFPSVPELQRNALVELGVPPSSVLSPAGPVDNTAQEAALLRQTVQTRGWTRAIVVTSKYHTRRSGFAFRRALQGTGATVVI